MRSDFKHRKKYLAGTSIIAFVLITMFVAPALAVDIELIRATVSKTTIKPGEVIEVNYVLRSSGAFSGAFNMGIFIAKGSNDKWLKKWGLPGNLLDQLQSGQTISQSWHVTIPEWGDGIYRLSVHADVDNYLHETNRGNNLIEKQLRTAQVATFANNHQIRVIKPIMLAGVKSRLVSPNGSIKLKFADGSSRVLSPDGKVTPHTPSGAAMTPYSLQIPVGDMPPIPNEAGDWINAVQDRLFEIIKSQLKSDELPRYMPLESGKTNYELVLWRINFIDFLLSEKEEAAP